MAPYIINSLAVVILAAGQSSRLGRAKQLLPFRGKPLLEHAIHQARLIKPAAILIVIGANAEEIQGKVNFDDVIIVNNPQWRDGLSSSIVCGIEALKEQTQIDGVLIMTCDQPYAEQDLLLKLINTQALNGSPICASAYGGSYGIPAIFHRHLFKELLSLNGDSGAKKIIKVHQEKAAFVSFERGSIDIDTASDYEKLIN